MGGITVRKIVYDEGYKTFPNIICLVAITCQSINCSNGAHK